MSANSNIPAANTQICVAALRSEFVVDELAALEQCCRDGDVFLVGACEKFTHDGNRTDFLHTAKLCLPSQLLSASRRIGDVSPERPQVAMSETPTIAQGYNPALSDTGFLSTESLDYDEVILSQCRKILQWHDDGLMEAAQAKQELLKMLQAQDTTQDHQGRVDISDSEDGFYVDAGELTRELLAESEGLG
mmetsp:Transcript_18986/g.42273  ORF Transcript_18986/g.42273 Transcript_18986/m.42273 type:complete len:191 (+) Transcript_18986:207-779(+)